MNIIKKSIATLAILATTLGFAQDSKTTFSGNADFYYRFDFANAGDTGVTNNLTSFTNSQDSFELGMATIKAAHKEGKASVFADLGFGKRAYLFSDDGSIPGIEMHCKTLEDIYQKTKQQNGKEILANHA